MKLRGTTFIPTYFMSESNSQRIRKLSAEDLVEEIDRNPISSPERAQALQVLNDRNQLKNQTQMSELTNVIKQASDSSKSLEGKLFWLNVVLTAATVVGAAATVVMAWPE